MSPLESRECPIDEEMMRSPKMPRLDEGYEAVPMEVVGPPSVTIEREGNDGVAYVSKHDVAAKLPGLKVGEEVFLGCLSIAIFHFRVSSSSSRDNKCASVEDFARSIGMDHQRDFLEHHAGQGPRPSLLRH